MIRQPEPISVRTTRLNNLILGKGSTGTGVTAKASASAAAFRRSLGSGGGSYAVSGAVAEAVNREGLLDAFCLLYDECDKEALIKRNRNIAEFVNKFRPIIAETRKLRVHVEDFNVKTQIGNGYFGNVHLVVDRQSHDVYAMKKIKKSVVTTSQVREERDIMSRRCSEWLTNLQYAFQDSEHLYLIMEFLPGGDLLSLMSRHGPFDEDLARFYLAELTLAIHSLHKMGYVHRDIKPENILIDRFGHIKLADFGNAAALDRDGHVMSLSPVGTPDYIAPELLQTISTYKLAKSMHDVSCDFWSMGIIGYELICEITPFHEENVHETYSKILSHCEDSQLKEFITFPSDLKVSTNFKDLIESLVTNPTNRLNYDRIKKHAYFETIKWETLRAQAPPIIPTVNGEQDTSNFEDIERNKGRPSTFAKKPLPLSNTVKSNDFSGKDLPFIGYSFVHMEKAADDNTALEEARFGKLNTKLKELQLNLKERVEEIGNLKQELLRAEQVAKQSDSQSKILLDAKEEIKKMKNVVKEKTVEVAACKTQIKTLQSSVKIEEEMWEKKEATITEMLRMNRQKYEEAKIASEQRYEKLIAEKKNELVSIVQKLDARESELTAKTEECTHLADKMNNYQELLRQFKQQSHMDKSEFEKNKMQLAETYEQKLVEMRNTLRDFKESKVRLTMELRDMRTELDDSICSTKSTEEAKNATAKNNDEILKRLNREIEANNALHALNVQLEAKLLASKKISEKLQHDVNRFERELQVAECGKNLAESELATRQTVSPYVTAPGSLTDLHTVEDQLRADLEAAKENENVQKVRADQLQEVVHKLEAMMGKFNANQAPRQLPTTVGDMLEKQNENLEGKLATVHEQMIVERQAARAANLALWKTEKQLNDTLAEKKRTKRRMELTEERIKRVQKERDDAQRNCNVAEGVVRKREQCIDELKNDVEALKRDVVKEHCMWEKAEQEHMKTKSEIMEHISSVHKLEECLSELRQKLQQTQQKSDALSLENKKLIRQLNDERDRNTAAGDNASAVQIQLKNLQVNYERLKYACTVTDNQLTEIDAMLEAEQKHNKAQQSKIDQLYASVRQKDESITQLQKEIHEEQSQRVAADGRIRTQASELAEHKTNLQETHRKLIAQQQQLVEQTNYLFATQERAEVLFNENNNLQTLNENYEREVNILKEENARILSDLFHAKEEAHRLMLELKEALANSSELRADIDELQSVLAEQQNYHLQRDIKSEATLAQHKKLIDYLQLKVEDLSQRTKKKTLADKLFGTSSSAKENVSPGAVEQSILYRALQEELRREKQRCKGLQEQIDKLNAGNSNITTGTILRSPLGHTQINKDVDNEAHTSATAGSTTKSPRKQSSREVDATTASDNSATTKRAQLLHHRFELSLQQIDSAAGHCAACQKPIVVGSPFWKCKECKDAAHRKCRSDVNSACQGGVGAILASGTAAETVETSECDGLDGQSLGKYSYEAKLDTVDVGGDYGGTLIFDLAADAAASGDISESLEVNCAYEMQEQRLLLLGCNSGLYAYHIEQRRLVHIAGIDAVSNVAVSVPLAKAIMVGSRGESLYQCDFRQLLSRAQANACLKSPDTAAATALEASVLDLPFANRGVNERWQIVRISSEAENALDSVAIAATSTRIVILKYELKLQKFKPVRALDTSTPVGAIMYTRHTAIVASEKFFEIDLDTYAAEEFVDISDQSLAHTRACQPVVALSISRQEFLLCYMECGVFVDEYGCRSRPYDLNWEYTPTGFAYRAPFLYIAHFQSVQVLRLQRSYSKHVAAAASSTGKKDIDDDASATAGDDDGEPGFRRAYLPFYMPTLLTDSGRMNTYSLAIQKDTGLQQIYHLDALRTFKQKLNDSLETISSIATSVTLGSVTTMDSI